MGLWKTTHTGGNHQHTGGLHSHEMPFGWDSAQYYAWLDSSGNPIYGSSVVSGVNKFSFGTTNFGINSLIRIGFVNNRGNVLTTSNGAVANSGASVTTSGLVRPRNISLLACIKF